MRPRILDCTLRDGGYHTGWRFDAGLVTTYLHTLAAVGVDIVEPGFRALRELPGAGPFAHASDALLDTLDIPPALDVAVMVDADDALAAADDPGAAIVRAFAPRAASRVALVRIAVRLADLGRSRAIAEALARLGYGVGLNLMQVAGIAPARLAQAARDVAGWGCVQILCLADSFGALDPAATARACAAVRTQWRGELGFHAHDNRSLAVANTLAAIAHGACVADCTVAGMGRGAGNAALELLLCELDTGGAHDERLRELQRLCERYFVPLRRRHGWGPGFYYHYCALRGIHPMFAQTLIGDPRYSPEERFAALRALAARDASRFSRSEIALTMHAFAPAAPPAAARAAPDLGRFAGAEVLLIGAGDGARRHVRELGDYIRARRPLVLALNRQDALDPHLVDAFVCIDALRLLCEASHLAASGKPVWTPRRLHDAQTRATLRDATVLDYDCELRGHCFEARRDGCVLPAPLACAYALALCVAGGARRVLLAGFDGFAAGDPRQQEMLELLALARPALERAGLTLAAATPTSYPVDQGELHAVAS